ncbi:hypothetical protein [Candidatus Tokpelaia sp.]|nr:hypothetical protein [Candidatus Tokpelaia sp.]
MWFCQAGGDCALSEPQKGRIYIDSAARAIMLPVMNACDKL